MTGTIMQLRIDAKATLRAMAWVALREWLAADDYEPVARYSRVWARTSIGKEIEERQTEHWQWWKGDDGRGEELRDLKKQIPSIWKEEGWVTYEQRKQGRPRGAEHSTEAVLRAMSAYRDGNQRSVTDKTYKWARSILGDNTTENEPLVIAVRDRINEEIIDEVGAENLDGTTRTELAMAIGLPPTYTNRMVRWMIASGEWEEKQEQRDGSRERRLRMVKK